MPAEQLAWSLLRNRGILGLEFRRRHPLHGFIADFYCAELRLVLEIDGGIHLSPPQIRHDLYRTMLLGRHGIRVVRLRNEQVSRRSLETLLRRVAPERRPAPAAQR